MGYPLDKPPSTLRLQTSSEGIQVELPMVVSPRFRQNLALGGMAFGLLLIVIGLSRLLFLDSSISIRLIWLFIPGLLSFLIFPFLGMISRIQPFLWWPIVLKSRMPALRITSNTLHLRDHRGEQSIPLESIQGVRQDERDLVADRSCGRLFIAWELRPEERVWLQTLIGSHARRVREAMVREGHEVDKEAVLPASLLRLREREPG